VCPFASRHGNGNEPMALFGLLGSRRHERAGFALYTRSVEAARDPLYFERLGVPDTMDGRFDLIGLFTALTIRRLRLAGPPGPKLAQAVFDAMFADLDFNLRELGVGDLSVAKRMREMWEAFHGRALAYDAPLTQGDHAALADALGRNVWRGAAPAGAAEALARATLAQDAFLASQPLSALAAGEITFLPARDSLAEPVPA
jgi:cytochrome b pre-mRNA-processing protein 3